ncbi:MAG: calcium/sodium antiporter [Acidaminococcus sp.]|uniref:calcium/sodium antiporter n=1 Tax=Acidaminococcus sp. TaxID=1872103 RepID=UPI003F150FBF|nr:calcium/sodium antiporter [Clostridiales bacterium]
MIVSVLLFAVGFLLLIKGGDWFVDGATGIARRFHLPDIIVGATVVSIGTTLPEVMVSATGAMLGQGAMAYGNAIGSIICNTALIAGISVAFNPGPANAKTMKMPVIFFFSSAALYCVAAYLLGQFPRWMGLVMLAIFVVYLILNVRQGLKHPDEVEEEEDDGDAKPRTLLMELVLLVVGAALIAVGADLLVEHGTIIAQTLGVPETVIALTFVALGTSLPELVTTITSLKKGHASLGIGNVIGANVFNLVLVSGVAVTLAPFEVPVGKLLFGRNASLVLDIPLMLIVMLLLCVPALTRKKLERWQGIALLCIYAAFCLFQFFV